MFENLPLWLWISIALVAIFCVYWLIAKIIDFLKGLFKPFKKGNRYWCTVIAVSDGDTVTCRRFNFRRSVTKIRLAYIDAPESSQSYGKETQKMVMKLVYQKIVRIKIIDSDRYGRHVAEIYRYHKHVNEEIIKRGGAWVYTDYIKDKDYAKKLQKLQADAKKDKKGLWKESRPMNPSTYRKNN